MIASSPFEPFPTRAFALAALLALAAGAAHAQGPAQAPRTPPPRPSLEEGGLWSYLNPATSPFIPIPEIGTDPNSGTTIGILPVFLTTNEKKEITRIIAPDVIYNPSLGWGGHFRILSYPSTDTAWTGEIGVKQRIERDLDVVYSTGLLRDRPLTLTAHVNYDRSATGRFFGIGNETTGGSETNFTEGQGSLEGRVGWNLNPALQIAYDLRPHFVNISHGTFQSLPSIEERFPGVTGFGSEFEFLNTLSINYDTRDSQDVPTRGTAVTAYVGFADRALFSTVSYAKWGIDARHLFPIDPRSVLVGHLAARYTGTTGDTPFWALARLGGDRSEPGFQQPLRGFGADRFIDRNLFAADIEWRNRVLDLNLFATTISVEVSPFIDTGRVFHSIDENPLAHLHAAGGIGFRAIARPNIVGYVDIGFGGAGSAIFSGLGYAF